MILRRKWRNLGNVGLAVLLVLGMGFSIAEVNAQATKPNSEQEAKSLADKLKAFVARPLKTIDLPKGEASEFQAGIEKPPQGMTEDVTDIVLNGYIRYVPYEGKNYVQAVVTSVSKGKNTVDLPDQQSVNGQFETQKLLLTEHDDVDLRADPAVLDAAIKALASKSAEAENVEEEPQVAKQDAPQVSHGSAGIASTGNAETASQYQAPEQDDFASPTTEVKTTIEGCTVRIDTAQNIAVQTSKTQTYEDGKLKSESECTDSEIRYTLQKSFDGCTDIVDVADLTVYRQSKSYYNKDGSQITVSSCAKDTSATFTIIENTDGCAPVIDQAARKVTVYAKLIYTGSTNSEINVRGCAPSTTQSAYPMQQSYESCTYKVDLPNGFAYGRYKDFYVNKLATRIEVSDCTVDTAKKWAITEHEGSCKVYVDFTKDDEKVYKQSVMKFTDDKGVVNEARGCDKSTLTEPVAMVKDTNLCSIRHDFDKAQSHQMFIWKYTLDNVAYQASACADTEVIYPHTNYTLTASGAKVGIVL